MGNMVDWVKGQTSVGQATDWVNEQTWSGDLMDKMGNSGWMALLMPETYMTSTLTDGLTQNDPIVGAQLWEWMNAQALGDYEEGGNDGVPTWLGYPAVGAAAWLGGSAVAGAAGGSSAAGASAGADALSLGSVAAAGGPTVTGGTGAVAGAAGVAAAEAAGLVPVGSAAALGAAGAAGAGIGASDYLIANSPSYGADSALITPTAGELASTGGTGAGLSPIADTLLDAGVSAALPAITDALGLTGDVPTVTAGGGNMANGLNSSNNGIWGYVWEQQNPGGDFTTISNMMNEWQTSHPGENILAALQSDAASSDPILSKLSQYEWSGLQNAMTQPVATPPQYAQMPGQITSNTAANLNIPSQVPGTTSTLPPQVGTGGPNPANMSATSTGPAQAPTNVTLNTDMGQFTRTFPTSGANTGVGDTFTPDLQYYIQQELYANGPNTGIPGQEFAQAYDNLTFTQNAGGSGSPAAAAAQNTLSNSWANMWNAVDASFAQQEANQLQTLVETLGSAFKDTYEGGVAALSARGLSAPNESTTSDYWTSKWTQNAQTALAQGIRDIQNSTAQQRLAWNQFGISTAQDWDKFQVDAALTQRGQNLQYQTAANANATDIYGINTQAGVTQRGQDISLQQSQAANALNWAQFGINTQQNAQQFDINAGLTQRGQDIQANTAQNTLAQNWAQFNASQATDWNQYLLNLASATRGQDLGVQQNAANNALQASIANSELGWAQDSSMYNLVGSVLGNVNWGNLWNGISNIWS